MNVCTSFDGTQISYRNEGQGPPVILFHGYGVDGLGQFGPYDGILPVLEKRQRMFTEVFGGSPPAQASSGREGRHSSRLTFCGCSHHLARHARIRCFGKPREMTVYADSAMAKDVIALIAYLHLDSVDVIGFSMGAGTAARLLMLGPPQVKSAILAGIGDYAIEDTILEFPKDWPIPDTYPALSR